MAEAARDKVIVVGVDGSQASQQALRWAVQRAGLTGETVRAVLAWQYPVLAGSVSWAPVMVADGVDMHAVAEKTLADAVGKVDGAVRIEQRVVEGYPPEVLVSASGAADLLVVGSRGHGTFAGALLGSVSQYCAHHSECPVVIMRGQH